LKLEVRLFYIDALVRDNAAPFFVDFGSMPQENVTFQQLFNQALAAQQQKNWDEALTLYRSALDNGLSTMHDPQASVIYHNMSTIAYEKSDFFNAYVWSKKAVSLDAYNRAASTSLEQYAKKVEIPQITHQISSFQNLENLVGLGSLDMWLVLSLILLFLTSKFTFGSILQKRKNRMAQLTSQGLNWKPLVSGILFVVAVTGATIRWNFEQKTFAIITAEKTSVQTASGENKPIIYEAQPGIEVEVLQIQQDYAQVRYPGAFSGWVLKKNIEILSRQL
jgi:tetratricopeptide (TPR) repeat protein